MFWLLLVFAQIGPERAYRPLVSQELSFQVPKSQADAVWNRAYLWVINTPGTERIERQTPYYLKTVKPVGVVDKFGYEIRRKSLSNDQVWFSFKCWRSKKKDSAETFAKAAAYYARTGENLFPHIYGKNMHQYIKARQEAEGACRRMGLILVSSDEVPCHNEVVRTLRYDRKWQKLFDLKAFIRKNHKKGNYLVISGTERGDAWELMIRLISCS